ncbi:MAG TPA: type I restriction enzyme HsdR N-terminal domain-containing protein [Phycisphaerae bacterium]|nr:type I restriction enzyme HsdR N-terminal domain-containing protein [Phycisphaerae bacterium]
MASIPKKVTDRFIKAVPQYQKVLQVARNRDVNESDTVSILNDILGDVFGYDKYVEVTSEFAIRGTYCDLAMKVDDKVQFLVEAKAIGTDLKDNHVRQAIDYGANQGVQWVILTNGVEWRLYRIRFEKPVNFEVVCAFDFMSLNPRNGKDQELLFLLSKEGLKRNAREGFYERVQAVNRYVIGGLILSDRVLTTLRRELRKMADGLKVDVEEIEQLLRGEVLKRDVVEGEEAEAAQVAVKKLHKKVARRRTKQWNHAQTEPAQGEPMPQASKPPPVPPGAGSDVPRA